MTCDGPDCKQSLLMLPQGTQMVPMTRYWDQHGHTFCNASCSLAFYEKHVRAKASR